MSIRGTHARRRALAASAAALALAAGTLPAAASVATGAKPVGAWREQARFGPDDPWGSNLEVAKSGQALGTFRVAEDGCQGCVDNPTRIFQRRANDNAWTRYPAASPHAVVRADLGYGGYAAWLTRGGHTKIMELRDHDGSFRRPPVTVSSSYPAGAEVESVHALRTHSIIAVRYPRIAERLVDFQLLERRPDGTWAALPTVGSLGVNHALPRVTELSNGTLLVVWHELDAPTPGPLTGRVKAATYTAGGWSTPVTLRSERGFPTTLTATGGGALATWVDATNAPKVHSAFFDGTAWGPVSVLDPGPDTVGLEDGTAVIAGLDDTVTAAWLRETQAGARSVVGATWRPGAGWTGPLTALTGTATHAVRSRVDSFDLTTTPPGRVTLAWSTFATREPVFAAHRPAGSTTWTARERLGVGPGPTDPRMRRDVAIGASKNGRVTLLTNSADGVRVLRFRPASVQAASATSAEARR
jgi:hypothetical protein